MRNSAHLLALLISGFLALALRSGAGSITWDGDTSTDFEAGANWVGGVAPNTTTDVAVFNAATTFQPSLTVDRSIDGVNFQSAGWTLGGGFKLTPAVSGVSSAGTGTNTINCSVDAAPSSGAFSAAAGNLLIVNGVVTGFIGNKNGAGTVCLSGTTANTVIRWDVYGGTLELDKTGSGKIAQQSGNVYSGTVRWLQDNQAQNASLPIMNGGNAYVDLNNHNDGYAWGIQFNGGGHLSTGTGIPTEAYGIGLTAGTATATFSGKAYWYYSDKEINSAHGTSPSGIDFDMSADITTTDVHNFTVKGGVVVRLSGNNSGLTGWPVFVNTNSKLIVSNTAGSGTGTGPVTVSSGATLGGNGFLGPTGPNKVTINGGGILSPGESIGTLTVNGNLDFQNNAVYLLDANGTTPTSDLVVVTGDLKLGTNATVKLGSWIGDPTGDTFTLFQYGTLSGGPTTWTIDTSGTGWSWNGTAVDASGGFVRLSGLIPEPASFALLAIGGLALVRRRR